MFRELTFLELKFRKVIDCKTIMGKFAQRMARKMTWMTVENFIYMLGMKVQKSGEKNMLLLV